jgi:hypothetical protein
MNFRAEEALADSAGFEGKIVLRLSVPDDFFNFLLTGGAPLYLHVKITPAANERSAISFSLGSITAPASDPIPERLQAAEDIVPGEGG